MQIDGRWDKPIIKNKNVAIAIGITFIILAVVVFHDAYEVRGHDRPFVLKIVGFPQI